MQISQIVAKFAAAELPPLCDAPARIIAIPPNALVYNVLTTRCSTTYRFENGTIHIAYLNELNHLLSFHKPMGG